MNNSNQTLNNTTKSNNTNSSNPFDCLNVTVNTDDCKIVDDSVLKQFKIIMIFVLIILLIFLGFFIYNLIKCYLPKWRGQNKLQEEGKPVEIKVTGNDSSIQEKNQLELGTS